MFLPNRVTCAQGPNDRLTGMPPAITRAVIRLQAARRDQPRLSQTKHCRCSSREMEDESAATTSRAKKTTASPWPKGSCWNTAGMVMKVRPGPEAGSMPVAASTGKIIKPASTAIRLASSTTQRLERPTPSLEGR
ncbi:hypothetical protein D3C77_164420 [compost metagenome]